MAQKRIRERLDRAMVARGLAASREQAARLILAGAVTVDGHRVDKQGKLIAEDAAIALLQPPSPFASRGGGKLAAALDHFGLEPLGRMAMDIGASTGGFTDCLLQRGARRVYAVDVGYGQLDWRLRQDPRVVVLDRRNIRFLDQSEVSDAIQLAVIDLSFISLELVMPKVVTFLDTQASVVALVKPQFEVGRQLVGRGGIVRDDDLRQSAAEKIIRVATGLNLRCLGQLDSPVPGQKGNREILVGWHWGGPRSDDRTTETCPEARRSP